MTRFQRLCCTATLAAVVALVGGCGGGGSDDGPPPLPSGPEATLPDSATASVDAYTRFAGRLIAEVGSSQTATPLLLGAMVAPVSERAAPLAVE